MKPLVYYGSVLHVSWASKLQTNRISDHHIQGLWHGCIPGPWQTEMRNLQSEYSIRQQFLQASTYCWPGYDSLTGGAQMLLKILLPSTANKLLFSAPVFWALYLSQNALHSVKKTLASTLTRTSEPFWLWFNCFKCSDTLFFTSLCMAFI